ncbi:nucleoporin 88 isoform X1 [Nematolebias whitei]|uniref:nucleoporin 88 isoform X1 n=1 Tax=Nematolebias whitei TaxID=451745 RepID=UPI00189A0647|nr:nucleoporin 88 isoform X1 [Nematolebias whitei]
MAAFGSERWLGDLPNHAIFKKIREKLDLESKSNEKEVVKNLTFCLGGDFFVWDDSESVFYTTNLRQLNSEEESESSGKFQTLLCINPPLFDVCQVFVSPAQRHVALVGQRGVSVLELPQRWGRRSEFEGGRDRINCRTIPVAERFFTSSPSVSLRQAAWYPSETDDPHLVLLTSDNTIRFYGLKSPQTPAKVLSVSQSEDDSSVHPPARSYAASLGEVAVAFDFGPSSAPPRQLAAQLFKEQPVYPLYILYENGETYVSYTGHTNGLSFSNPAGPLPMYPAAEDNYGYDACAILCLPCVPSILVIATETGTLYHCVVLECDEEEESGAVEKWIRRAGAVPALYVFECVELELTLKVAADDDEPQEFDFTCPIRLHRDPLCQQRYHCTHEAGVHSVGLIWVNKLQRFLQSGEEDKDSLQELAAEKRCIVEHILCTRPLLTSSSAPVLGFLIVSDLSLGATMICITATYECIMLPLLSSIRPPSPPLLCSHPGPGSGSSPLRGLANDSFEQHIRNILARSSTNPVVLKAGDKDAPPPPPECLQLLSRATQVFREEYILKQDMAREEMQRRVKLLRDQKNKQLEELALCREEKKSLREAAERLADKYEDAKYRQETITNRVKKVLCSLQSQLPVLSNSEKDMKKELQTMSDQLKHLDNCIRQVNMKMEYQKKQVDKDMSAARTTVSLNAHQKKVVQDVLREQGQQIGDMMKQIKDVKNHFSF